MKLWVDDLRDPPTADWTWVQTSKAARWYLNIWLNSEIDISDKHLEVALDHDLGISMEHDSLGDEDTTRSVVLWLIDNEIKPDKITVHTGNPVGRDWLEGMIERYLS
jgi:hypothetical protein